ncbi:MAG: hypothetical protein Q9226_009449, partial [Calogaya cf. arnoldii]
NAKRAFMFWDSEDGDRKCNVLQAKTEHYSPSTNFVANFSLSFIFQLHISTPTSLLSESDHPVLHRTSKWTERRPVSNGPRMKIGCQSVLAKNYEHLELHLLELHLFELHLLNLKLSQRFEIDDQDHPYISPPGQITSIQLITFDEGLDREF